MPLNPLMQDQLLQTIATGHNHDFLFYLLVGAVICSVISFIFTSFDSDGFGLFSAFFGVTFFIYAIVVVCIYSRPIDVDTLRNNATIDILGIQKFDIEGRLGGSYKLNEEGYISQKEDYMEQKFRLVIPFTDNLHVSAVQSYLNESIENPTFTVAEYRINLPEDYPKKLTKKNKRFLNNAYTKYYLVLGINGHPLYTKEELDLSQFETEDLKTPLNADSFSQTSTNASQPQVVKPSHDKEYHVKPLKSGKIPFTNKLTDQILSENWGKDYNFILTDGNVETIHLSEGIKLFTSEENYILYDNGIPTEIHFILNDPNSINIDVNTNVSVE